MTSRVAGLATRLVRTAHFQATQHHPAPVTATESGLLVDSRLVSYPRLRDACQCPRCVHPTTRQKNYTSGHAYLQASARTPNVTIGQQGVDVNWPDHSSFYPWDQLHALDKLASPLNGMARRFWGNSLQLPEFEFASLRKDLARILHDLHTSGIILIRNAPVQDTSNEGCALREIANSIGEIRNTFYGELWDVKSVKQSRNVAYTNLDLGLHMDLLYFSNPPRFQALHCLRNRVAGGESYIVDAFRAVDIFRELHPHSAQLVNDIGIEFEYDNDGHFLRYRHPLYTDDLQSLHAAVNWSPPFQAKTVRGEHEYYRGLHEFEEILKRPELRYEFLLREGDVMMFDNRRILHARRAFDDKGEDGSEPNRWLKGCYLDGEVIWDRLATLHRTLRTS